MRLLTTSAVAAASLFTRLAMAGQESSPSEDRRPASGQEPRSRDDAFSDGVQDQLGEAMQV